ncbi:MAG: hypothetical protein SGJ21_11720 [Alphaproteobacteria bacterium]|nr:hypothetical protein [Alphaproteobacteria bacterium]
MAKGQMRSNKETKKPKKEKTKPAASVKNSPVERAMDKNKKN